MGTISADRKEYIALKASGTCTCCKVELATDGTAECKKCRQEHLGRNERRRNKLMAEGLCSGCLRNKPAPGMKMCASCRILRNAKDRRNYQKAQAEIK